MTDPMTPDDPIRTALAALLDAADRIRDTWPHDDEDWDAVRDAARAALATPPASPEPERYQPGLCVHVYEDGAVCGVPHDRSIHPPLGEAPRGRWVHPFLAPTPPESAEALRDALLDKVCTSWDYDAYGEYEAAQRRLIADLDAIIAAARATPPLTVEHRRLRDAVRSRDVDEALRALDALEQGR